ncbi:hypothetical protein Tco_1215157 [Tanacetum coccineum]
MRGQAVLTTHQAPIHPRKKNRPLLATDLDDQTNPVDQTGRCHIRGERSKDIIAEFYSPSWWKELIKETSSKILPYGDGSCWKTFKLIASLIAKGKLK